MNADKSQIGNEDKSREFKPTKALIFTGGDCDCDLLVPELNVEFFGGSSGNVRSGILIIAADSGYKTAKVAKITPHIIIGDMDSIDALPESNGIEIIRANPEKDDTDTMLAVTTAISRGAKEILIAGGTGGRCDHTLSNVFLLEHIEEAGAKAAITDGRNYIRIVKNDTVSLKKRGYRYFSILALDQSTVTVTGCKYPLKDAPLRRNFPYAVSNEIAPESSHATVEVLSGTVVLIESDKQTPDFRAL